MDTFDYALAALMTALLGAMAYVAFGDSWWLFASIVALTPVALYDLWTREETEDEGRPADA